MQLHKLTVSQCCFGILTPKETGWGFFFSCFFSIWAAVIKLQISCSKAECAYTQLQSSLGTITNYCLGRSSCSWFLFAFTALGNCCVNNRVLSMSLPGCFTCFLWKDRRFWDGQFVSYKMSIISVDKMLSESPNQVFDISLLKTFTENCIYCYLICPLVISFESS